MHSLKWNCFLISLWTANGHLWSIPSQSQCGLNGAADLGRGPPSVEGRWTMTQ